MITRSQILFHLRRISEKIELIFEFSNFQIQHHLLYLFQINGLESAWLYLERPLQRGGGVGLRRHRGVGDGGGLRQVQTKSRLLSKPFCVLNA